MSIILVAEGTRYQTPAGRVPYSITTTNLISSPTSPVVTAYDESVGLDVTSTVFPTNSPSVSGDKISLSLLRDLTVDHSYRIDVKFTVSSTIYRRSFIVKCIDK